MSPAKPSSRSGRRRGPAKPAAEATTEPAPTTPDDPLTDELLDRLFARSAPLSAGRRAYFERQQPAARAESVGTRTSARDTVRAALRVYVQIADAAARHPKRFATFTPALQRWLLENLLALRDALADRGASARSDAATSASLRQAMSPARNARNALLRPLELYVEGDDADESGLATARGDVLSPAALVTSLRDLAGLADALLARRTEDADIAAEESGLSGELAAEARAAADALQRAIDADTAAGRKDRADRDAPALNVLEGRVTLTLRRMRKIHTGARAEDTAIAPLEIPASLRRALGAAPRAAKPPKKPAA